MRTHHDGFRSPAMRPLSRLSHLRSGNDYSQSRVKYIPGSPRHCRLTEVTYRDWTNGIWRQPIVAVGLNACQVCRKKNFIHSHGHATANGSPMYAERRSEIWYFCTTSTEFASFQYPIRF